MTTNVQKCWNLISGQKYGAALLPPPGEALKRRGIVIYCDTFLRFSAHGSIYPKFSVLN